MSDHPSGIPSWAYGVSRLVVCSGAGISTESGIADFRGPSGAWIKDPTAQHRNTYQGFMADPELRAAYWKSRYEHEVWQAEPNAGHRAVAELIDSEIDTTVVTQNTDGLHQLAGAPADRVVELHGTMRVVLCVACGRRSPTTEVLARIAAGEAVPPCAECGGILKTASTMFGQTMDPAVFTRAERAVVQCDLMLAVGTTLTVEPAGSLAASAVHAGARLVIVNLGETPYDSIATDILREPIGEALPRIVRQLKAVHAGTPPPAAGPSEAAAPVRVPRPSLLLRAEARTARLHARSEELRRLTAWLTGEGTRAHLVWGPAGSGKSRLALELADRVRGDWDVEFLAPGAGLPSGGDRPSLLVVDDAETRREQVARILGAAGERPALRVLLCARTRDGWWEEFRSESNTDEELTSPYATETTLDHADTDGGTTLDHADADGGTTLDHADAVRETTRDYADTLTAMGFSCPAPDQAPGIGLTDATRLPGGLQAAVLAGLLSLTGDDATAALGRLELAHLRWDAAEHGLAPAADVVEGAVATAVLCGAADEEAARDVLGHLPALQDDDLRLLAARWLREACPPAAASYWAESLPDPLLEELVAAVVSPKFLMGMLMETTQDQNRRALTTLARAAATRPALRVLLTELLSILPGLSPNAVDAALHGGYPAPLADALISLARNAALPAELLEDVPAGTTVLGDFAVLLAESLVEAYEYRVRQNRPTAQRGLATMLSELAERLADLGRAEEALAAARRAVEAAEKLPEQPEHLTRAETALRRAADMAG
ncbi:hypothetical protein ITP53_01870 [Nonomuraea sp. K274]|uniref:protein acetyllysine N-acetyltransferase n=1 Tax=Nonomuraea cypriaca TaxID=1187855 RepID=A0A931A1K5_9ACTN|nr:Sir2 family NAD-dependent protein deacetylase [Nonomuraea cypriaca]MBF8184512.1 hypothetical protein [Nonomuraea cypriaca]